MRLIQYLTEAKITKTKTTLYHGVRKERNVIKILEKGFSLLYIKPRWMNDNAVSTTRTKKAAQGWFGKREVTILKFKFNGTIMKLDAFEEASAELNIFPSDARDYTRKIIAEGVDAVDTGGAVYVYNLKAISNIEIA